MEVFAQLPLELRHRICAMATDAYVLEAMRKFQNMHGLACHIVAVQADGQALFLSRGMVGAGDPINTGNWRRCSDGGQFANDGWANFPARPADGARLFGLLDRYDAYPPGHPGAAAVMPMFASWRKVVASAAAGPSVDEAVAAMFLTLRRLHNADPAHM